MVRSISFIFILFFIISTNIYSMECKCHSKDNAMRRMHEMIGFKNCANCHTQDENLMQSKAGNQKENRTNKLKKRFVEDKFCFPCHNVDGSVKKEVYKNSERMAIIDTYFCPKDKTRYIEKIDICPKCGGKLLDINKLIEQSKKNPSNDICRQCHIDSEITNFNAHLTIKKEKLFKCLECHSDHDDCGSCHH